ncbi:MAG TPA: transcriptional repressor [Candidatus Latescibacteria bacterium]|nr:transcriptional repressor [Candidatus Latescibacterota bacterium]
MTDEAIELRQYLRERGLRFTPEREAILEEAVSIHGHFDVSDIFTRLRERGSRISMATVYRTLNLLVEAGLLREIITDEKHKHYEHIYGHTHHDHLFCIRCGKIVNFEEPQIEELQQKVCEREGFEPKYHRLQIMGYCRGCRKEAEE